MTVTETPDAMAEQQIVAATNILKLVADPHRVMVLLMLEGGGRVSGEISGMLNSRTSVRASDKLALMSLAGLVAGRREGKNVRYEITDRGRAMLAAVRACL